MINNPPTPPNSLRECLEKSMEFTIIPHGMEFLKISLSNFISTSGEFFGMENSIIFFTPSGEIIYFFSVMTDTT